MADTVPASNNLCYREQVPGRSRHSKRHLIVDSIFDANCGSKSMDRREFLATVGVALAAPLSGCLDETGTENDSAGPRTSTGDDSSDRPWPPSDPVETPDGAHHLFVANHTDTTEQAWLRVVRKDGVALVDGRYELPDERGIEFEAIAAWETTYTIDLAIDGEDVTSLEWHTEACGSASEASGDGGSRNATVRIEDSDTGDRVSFVVDQCDALFAPEVPTGPAEAFRLDA